MYKKIHAQFRGKNKYLMHLWTDDGGYEQVEWWNTAYQECSKDEATHRGIHDEPLKKVYKYEKNQLGLHFGDMPAHQKFLIEKYGTNDEPSTGHREVFFDIETEMGDALTVEYIESAPKKVTSIAWWDKQLDEWGIVILDPKNQIEEKKEGNRHIIPCRTEQGLLATFIEKYKQIDPDILIGYNSDYFDIPYLYYRICKILGPEWGNELSPIGQVQSKATSDVWYYRDCYVRIAGIQSLDYIRLHKKYSWADEPSWKLDAIGEKYVGKGKIEYDGSLDRLFEEDIEKFMEYNFVDVEILKLLDEKLQYLALTRNISHKGKHNYEEVYASSKTQDGAISAYLISQGMIPPQKDRNPIVKKNYAGGYLFCPVAGLYKYMFDEDLTSLYPSIIMTLNVGKETFVARIIPDNDRDNHLALNDLKSMDPNTEFNLEYANGNREFKSVSTIISAIENGNLSISANGAMFQTDRESLLSTILQKWFEERVIYKGKMKKAYKAGNSEEGEYYHLMQYTMKILLNSLYGALALPSFRYGSIILSESITLSGQRIIQESALCANRHMNKVIKGQIKLDAV
jgi:DNA polymerase elongation subunit (family B)